MWHTDYSGLCHGFMRHQCTFNFCSTEAVSGYIQDIIYTTGNPVVTIFITPCSIPSEIGTRIGGEISLDEALRITPDAAHLPRPGVFNHQIALSFTHQFLAIGIDYGRLYAEERPCRRTRL